MSKILTTFVNKTLSLSYLGKKWITQLTQSIIEAGRTISYVETLEPRKSDKLHLSIKNSDKKLFMREFERAIRFAIPKLKLKKVKLAFDATEDLTWMKNNHNLRASAYNKHLPAWQYLTLSIVEPYFVPLMSVPYTMLDNLDRLVINLLQYLETLPLSVDLILFDRGFYHAHLIDYLNSKSWPYLILIPETKKIKKYIEKTRSFAHFSHEFEYAKDKSNWRPKTTVIVRHIKGETYFCYATNQKPSLWLTLKYKKRWNIETGFRVHDEVRIKSKSRFLLIRFFYHLIGMLMVLIWRLNLTKRKVVFKRFLKDLEFAYSGNFLIYYPPGL